MLEKLTEPSNYHHTVAYSIHPSLEDDFDCRWFQVETEEFGADVVFDGDIFNVVEEFVYLVTLVTCDNDGPTTCERHEVCLIKR